MKKLDRYILTEFFSPLALIAFGFAGLVLLVQVVDTLPGLAQWKPAWYLLVLYHLLRLPYLLMQVLPVSVMLATLISLGGLARSSELAAMRAGGISVFRIAIPILLAALGISLLHGLVSELVVPYASDAARYIEKVKIEHRLLDWESPWRERMTKSVSGGRQFYIDRYDASKAEMGGVVIIRSQDGRLVSRIDAASGVYQGDQWVFLDGVKRTFSPDGQIASVQPFKRLPLDVTEKPSDFLVNSDMNEDDLLELSALQLARIVRILKLSGSDYRKDLVCLYVRLSYPLSCFILALLGVALPFLFPYGQRAVVGAAMGILASLVTGMLYLVFIQVGLSLGKAGVLPPLAAAWISNCVFLVVGGLTLRKACR